MNYLGFISLDWFYDLFTSYEMELRFYDLFTSYEIELEKHVHVLNGIAKITIP